MKNEKKDCNCVEEQMAEAEKDIIEEIQVEDLTVDGICGVY